MKSYAKIDFFFKIYSKKPFSSKQFEREKITFITMQALNLKYPRILLLHSPNHSQAMILTLTSLN